jgi:hypothetical protein
MRRMQGDQAELAIPDAFDNAISIAIGDGGVSYMSPPNDDIRRIERGWVETLLPRNIAP